ncbi:unnamed protein product [Durusdinium trenchii]|uniref:TauD/TfdA-like domain-containing protein n=1 Tax=Durusdinium trenchii TaxID=1381693 RepID=A0ABP0HZL0_9DINO
MIHRGLEEVLHELQFGTGAALLQFPADWLLEQGEEGSQRAFLGLCAHLGRPVTQSTDLQELCARVEVARSPEVLEAKHTQRRGYRNAQDQFLHNDSSIPAARGQGVCDVLAMLCFRPARSGGLSKMASARKIHELLQQQPRVLESVRHGFKYDAASVEYHPDWRQPPRAKKPDPWSLRMSMDSPVFSMSLGSQLAWPNTKTCQHRLKHSRTRINVFCIRFRINTYIF